MFAYNWQVPAVFVDIPPDMRHADGAQILAQACSQASRAGECVITEGARGQEDVPRARVSWLDAERCTARIVISNVAKAVNTEMRFPCDADETERWRALGYVLAALLEPEARSSELAVPNAANETSQPPETSQASPPSQPRDPPQWRIAGGAMGAPAFEDGTWRLGAWLNAAWKPNWAPLGMVLALQGSGRPQDAQGVSAEWIWLGGGLELTWLTTERWLLRADVLAGPQWLTARVDAPPSAGSDVDRQRDLSFQFGAHANWLILPPLSLQAGLRAQVGPAIPLNVRGQQQTTTLAVSPVILLGVAAQL